MARPSRSSDQFILRLPDGLRDRIKAAAEKNNRSMNSEVVERVQYTFDELDAVLFDLHKRIENLRSQNISLEVDAEGRRSEIDKLRKRISELEREVASQDTQISQHGKSLLSWDEWATEKFTDENTIYVLLDADGHPQSWDEIMTHIRAISDAAGGNIERIDAAVVDAVRAKNDLRAEQWMKLRKFYRSKKRNKS